MSAVVDVLLAELDEVQLRRLAARLAPYLEAAGPAPHELLTAQEAATLLRCRPKRVYELVQRGDLPAQRDGRRVLIRRTEVDDYLSRSPSPSQENATPHSYEHSHGAPK